MKQDSLAQYLFSFYFSRCRSGVFGGDEYFFYENNIGNDLVKNTVDLYGTDQKIYITSDKVFYSINFNYLSKEDTLRISLKKSKKICVSYYKAELYDSYLCKGTELKLVIFGSNNTIYYEAKGQLVPLSIKKLVTYINPIQPKITFADELLDHIFSFYSKYNPFVNDIRQTIANSAFFIIPLNFNEILKYHSKKDFFLQKYKLSSSLNINWNKRDMNISYLIIKSWNMVKPECRNKLLQITELNLPFAFWQSERKYKTYCIDFLVRYIMDNISKNKYSIDVHIIEDYVEMCNMTKEKVNINLRSEKAIGVEHDRISVLNYMKETPLVKIKKNTRFKNLRKILPDEFEWIKTRKRLIEETVMQHHCVWSYAETINRDACQIYSFVTEDGERFTLEFRINRNKYYLKQIQGKYNQGDTSQVTAYVNELLSTNNTIK